MKVENGMHVHIHYTLKDDDGNIIDSSAGREALAFAVGQGDIILGLEKALLGKQIGDHIEVVVNPEEGYGERFEEAVQTVPKAQLAGIPELVVGMPLQAETDEGPVHVFITAINEDSVTLDGNHPLAGMRLHFSVDIEHIHPLHDAHHDEPRIILPN